jgi:NitT/TauT family transport system substrate-binding protein
MRTLTRLNRRSFLVLSGGLALATACGSRGGSTPSGNEGRPASVDPNRKVTLRLGYFPNMTHAQPQVALQRGTLSDALGTNVTLNMSKTFNAGPAEMEALLAGAIDAAYVGPSPATTTFAQTDGKELRIVAGATSGGALLIVRPGANLDKPSDFANKRIATPQLGNTQDVALRAWLLSNGLKPKENGGNVLVLPTNNADTLTLFQTGNIDGAWVPEPWATLLQQQTGGRVYLDERSLWPNGQFATTVLVVRASYLQANPDVIDKLVGAHVDTTLWIKSNPDEAKKLVNQNIAKITNASLPQAVIDAAWMNQEITYDPVAPSIKTSVDQALKLGFYDQQPDLSHLFDLAALNRALQDKQLPAVKGLS